MEKKNQKSARGRIKDIYGNEIPSDISFAEYWERQHLIEKYSMEESIRQKAERANEVSRKRIQSLRRSVRVYSIPLSVLIIHNSKKRMGHAVKRRNKTQ